ncbi:unnamed protein product [Polarella glacialis]|uniref:Peptidase C1A papain C-terminal domain-containing protein n=1 Tax=Polarella glacialis TaxID=89957 RepID=A0A813J918_POLGL|nr:unnamed protein product [Polarella glacialis]
MRLLLVVVLGVLPSFSSGAENSTKCTCYRPSKNRDEHVLSPRMHELLTLVALPQELDWRNKDGINYLTMSRNQHIPYYCGACWAFATTAVLSDRLRIARGPSGPEVNLAVQVVLNCDMEDVGCSGGDALPAWKFIKEFGGIPSETCQPYTAEGRDTGKTCLAMDVCKACDSKGCFSPPEHEVYGVAEYGKVKGEYEMMAELQRGPIACGIATPGDFCNLTGDSIYEDKVGGSKIDHLISVVGYGEENGVKFWVIRNSWGTYWGHYGFARVVRGKNNIKIEEDCAWVTPSNGGRPIKRFAAHAGNNLYEKPGEAAHDRKHEVVEPIASVAAPDSPACRVHRNDWEKVGGELVLSPRPQDTLAAKDLPKSWDWRNVSGQSYVTSMTNEHAPTYCGSCWAQGVASALSDRLSVQQKGSWPKVALAPQVLLNCVAGGSCKGGDPAGAYSYMHRNGIVDQTCQLYQGRKLQCSGHGVCETCAPSNDEHGLVWPGHCAAVSSPVMYFVSEYGSVRGAQSMKAEIYQRGPIGCGLQATRQFRSYSGGIYSESADGQINHQVSVAGWGRAGRHETEPRGTEFWIGRNSWGTFWGEDGWFRIRMHDMNLGIEHDCDWGVPVAASDSNAPTLALDSLVHRPPRAAQGLALLSLVAFVGAIAAARRRWSSESLEESDQYAYLVA